MSRRQLAFTAVLLATLASPLVAQTVQQRFEAATAKLDAKDAAGALAALDVLETELAARAKPPVQSLALVRARKAEALTQLRRLGDARASYVLALGSGALDSPATIKERDAALLRLGQLEEAELDHAAGARSFLRLGEAAETTTGRIVGLAGTARLMMFTDPAAALATVDKALAMLPQAPDFDKADQSTIVGTRGRILLNMGRVAEARKELDRAIALRGGLTLKADLWDVALRSDAALAALRESDKNAARKYLAYTGAGRTETLFPTPAVMPLPTCDEDGVTRDDVAVVQLAIGTDGSVISAQPVLASRPGEMVYAFARAASDWHWRAEELSGLNPFFRVATRIQMRCSTAASRPPVTSELDVALGEWLVRNGAAPVVANGDPNSASVAALRSALAAAPASGKAAPRIAALWTLAGHWAVEYEERSRYAAEALTLIEPTTAPPAARLALRLTEIAARVRADKRGWRSAASREADALRPLLDEPSIAADPRLKATVRLAIAQKLGAARRHDQERLMLEAVANDPALGDKDQIKIGALVALANLAAAQKRIEDARLAYARTGLSAQQCALVDGGPVRRRAHASPGDYPREATEWGFEGWTTAEFDVSADGRPVNVRTVAAYPPGVFAEAGRDVASSARFSVSYRPEGDLACGGMQQRVRFQIPGG